MFSIAESLDPVGEKWAGLMLAAVWQTTVLALAIAFLTSRLKKASPVVRYWLWQVVAFKLLVVPFWTVLVPLPELFPRSVSAPPWLPQPDRSMSGSANRPVRTTPVSAHSLTEPEPILRPLPSSQASDLNFTTGLMGSWVLVVAVQVFLVFRQRTRLVHLLRRSRWLDDSALKRSGGACRSA